MISAQGWYPNDIQETLMIAVQTAVSASGLIQWDNSQKWASGSETSPPPHSLDILYLEENTGTCNLATFASYIGVNVWSDPVNAEAHLDITITLPDSDDGFCDGLDVGLLGIGGSIVSAFDAFDALGGFGAFLGIFGSIAASSLSSNECSLSMSHQHWFQEHSLQKCVFKYFSKKESPLITRYLAFLSNSPRQSTNRNEF